MPKIDEASLDLKEDETSQDPYLAQLALQKATRVQSAQALLEKAQKDPKANKVIKAQNKRGRGKGRGKGKGRQGAQPAAASENQHAAVDEEEQVEGDGDTEGGGGEDTSVPAKGDDGPGDDEVPKEKKKYTRKELSADELKIMWNEKVSCLSQYFVVSGFEGN
jgi:hypothetical protein